MLRNYFIHDNGCEFSAACAGLCEAAGFTRTHELHLAEFAIAPLLRRKLGVHEYSAPRLGTLVFHPSALPYRRGPDAIRHAVAAGERVSASTWFWCREGLDTGPICEQEVVVLHPEESPGCAYHTRFIAAGLRALQRALDGIVAGNPRSIVQETPLATYDKPLAV